MSHIHLALVADLAALVLVRLNQDRAALLALAHQYAEECGDCAGQRVTPDGEPCPECVDIWKVIDKAEGRT